MNSTPVSRRICACGRYFYIQKKKAEELFIKKQIVQTLSLVADTTPSVFCCREAATKSSSPCKKGEPRTACIVLFQKFTQKTAAGIVRRHSLSKNEAFRQTDHLHADRVQGSVIFCLSGGLCFAAISGKV